MISRQKLVGWALIVFSAGFLLYFLRVRLLTAGPPIAKKEWLEAIGVVALLTIGTMNVRLAALRRQGKRLQSPFKRK